MAFLIRLDNKYGYKIGLKIVLACQCHLAPVRQELVEFMAHHDGHGPWIQLPDFAVTVAVAVIW